MSLKNLVLLGVFGAAGVVVARAARAGSPPTPSLPPTPAQLFDAHMKQPDPPRRADLTDPHYGIVRRDAPHHAPYSLN